MASVMSLGSLGGCDPESDRAPAEGGAVADAGGPTATSSGAPRTDGGGGRWTPTTGGLTGGAWHAPAGPPDPAHAGAYGAVAYAPNGDLYAFYQKGVYPNEVLHMNVRRHGASAFSFDGTEKELGTRSRTATVTFLDAGALVASESFGAIDLYSCAHCDDDRLVTWTQDHHYIASDGNNDGAYALDYGFVTADGPNLGLTFAYLYRNSVVGGASWGVQRIVQSGSTWPADGTPGTPIDVVHPPFAATPHGMSGAFQDGAGTMLVFSSRALRSTDHGASFVEIMASGVAAQDLTGVSGACANPTDGSVLVSNLYQEGESWRLRVWGTQDLGASFAKLHEVAIASPHRARMVAVQNRVVVAFTTGSAAGPSLLWTITSQDGGTTWSSPAVLVDATSILGARPSFTLGDVSLTSSPSGSIALQYSIVDGVTNRGVYLQEYD